MSFRNITLLWLLAVVPLALAYLVARERARTQVARRFAAERLRGMSNPARSVRPWLLSSALALAIVAFAGPYSGFTLVPIVTRDASRVIVIDVSRSMAAEDVGTSRLGAAKAVAARIADSQQGRVGLIVFEAGAEVVSPLTTDTAAVAALIETLVPGEVGQPGSDIGSATIAALRLIEADPAPNADIVLISDGEEQGVRVAEAAQRARARGVQVSTIVIGSAQGSTIPTPRGPLRDSSGEVVTTYARDEVMSELASRTGGRSFTNPFAARALDPLIGDGRGAATRQTHVRVPIDRYQWPLALAFLALLAGSVLNRGAE